MKKFRLLLFALAMACNALGANHYVAQKNAKASDDNPGTEELP